MIVFDTFVPSSVPLEAEKEEQVVKDWIYRGEEDYTTSITTPISPMHYGKGYSLPPSTNGLPRTRTSKQ